MAHAFTFLFASSPAGHPRLLHLVDLLADCPTCGYEEIQRFYHPGPLHTLTLPRYRAFLHDAPQLLSYACSNCGADVRPQHATRAAVTLPFADRAGLVRSFLDLQHGAITRTRHTLHPHEPFDAQALPAWDPPAPDHPRDTLTHLTDEDLLLDLGRVFNLKAAWRRLLLPHDTTPRHLHASKSTTLVFAPDDATLDAYLRDLHLPTPRLPFDLLTPPPPLRPLQRPEHLPGNPHAWLPTPHPQARLVALLDPEEARAEVASTLESAKLSYEYREDDLGVFAQITTPRDTPAEQDLPLRALLARAAWTALTPGEAARLSAEELIASLLNLPILR